VCAFSLVQKSFTVSFQIVLDFLKSISFLTVVEPSRPTDPSGSSSHLSQENLGGNVISLPVFGLTQLVSGVLFSPVAESASRSETRDTHGASSGRLHHSVEDRRAFDSLANDVDALDLVSGLCAVQSIQC
jgi:hypothetical protein